MDTNDYWEPEERIGNNDLAAKKKFRDEVKAPPTSAKRKAWAKAAAAQQQDTEYDARYAPTREIKKGGWLDTLLGEVARDNSAE